MKIQKAYRRDKKINRRTRGMVVDNKGIFLLEKEIGKRASRLKKQRKKFEVDITEKSN